MIDFPRASGQHEVVDMPFMARCANRTLAVHGGGGLVIWTGRQRIGKSTTARRVVESLADKYEPEDPRTFRCLHYEVGTIRRHSGNEGKKAIRSLYEEFAGPLDEGEFRRKPIEKLARLVVKALQIRNLELVFVDEAGLWSIDAIRGLVLVRDVAENRGQDLTVVLIGMDDLASKVQSVPQVRGRVDEWVYFKPYDLEDTHRLLAALHPHFAALDLERPEHREQVAYLHEQYQGVAGHLVSFVRKLHERQARRQRTIDLTLLKALHLATLRDKEAALRGERSGWRLEDNDAA